MKKRVFLFCENEMQKNPKIYTDSGNCFNFTQMGEAYINAFEISEDDCEEVFELVVDWFNQWPENTNFNL